MALFHGIKMYNVSNRTSNVFVSSVLDEFTQFLFSCY